MAFKNWWKRWKEVRNLTCDPVVLHAGHFQGKASVGSTCSWVLSDILTAATVGYVSVLASYSMCIGLILFFVQVIEDLC